MLVPSQTLPNGTEVESENDPQTESVAPGDGEKEEEALWTGSHNPERPIS